MSYVKYDTQTMIAEAALLSPRQYNIAFVDIEDQGIPGWRSGLAPAFGPGRNPGDSGSNPTLGSGRLRIESHVVLLAWSLLGACFSLCLCLCLSLSMYLMNK